MQQTRIRQSMRRVDPEGTLLRPLEMKTICRRKYSVAGPLSLWHIDGNHKFIRFVTSFVSCLSSKLFIIITIYGNRENELSNDIFRRNFELF